jgi:hypothetical protein
MYVGLGPTRPTSYSEYIGIYTGTSIPIIFCFFHVLASILDDSIRPCHQIVYITTSHLHLPLFPRLLDISIHACYPLSKRKRKIHPSAALKDDSQTTSSSSATFQGGWCTSISADSGALAAAGRLLVSSLVFWIVDGTGRHPPPTVK